MKIVFFIIVFIAGALLAAAQHNKIDSLNQLISKSKTDTGRINLLVRKTSFFIEINMDSAIRIGGQVVEEATRFHYKKGEANARMILGSAYSYKGEYTVAREMVTEAGKIYFSLKDTAGEGRFYSKMGVMCSMQSKYDSSIVYYKIAIPISQSCNDTNTLNDTYQNLAIAYMMQSDYSNAIQYLQKALSYSEKTGDEESQAYNYLNLGITYMNMDDSIRAERSLLKAVELSKNKGLKNVELYTYSNLASFYDDGQKFQSSYDYAMKAATLGSEMGDDGIASASLSKASSAQAHLGKYAQATNLGLKAIRIAELSKQPWNIYQAYSSMGLNLKIQGDCAQAIGYFEKAIHSLPPAQLYDKAVRASYSSLSECYEKSGAYEKALLAYKTATQINDSIRSNESLRKATELNMNYEFEKKQQTARIEQEKKNTATRARQKALLIGLIFAVILALVLFYAFRNKQKTNTLLRKQKGQIEQTLTELKATQQQLVQSEKMASLGELTAGIAHEIQNPLNFVNNFSEVNSELIGEMRTEIDKGNIEEAKLIADDIQENEQKIIHHGKRAGAIVKSMLQHSRTGGGNKEPVDINALADEYFRLSYHGVRATDKTFNAKLQTDFDRTIGSIHIVPQDIGRVLFNLYNNAFYSVNEKRKTLQPSLNGSLTGPEEPVEYEPTIFVGTKAIKSPSGDLTVLISVKDNGTGIPAKILDKIFQPFFTTKPTGQGTGLGLSLSYDIIKAHGGELKVKTEPGEGTEFIVQLPGRINAA